MIKNNKEWIVVISLVLMAAIFYPVSKQALLKTSDIWLAALQIYYNEYEAEYQK